MRQLFFLLPKRKIGTSECQIQYMFCRYEEIACNRGPLMKLRSISVYVRAQVFSILKVQFTYISLGFFILS